MRNMMMPILKHFLPVLISDCDESDSSSPPTIQRISAMVVGSWAIWMMRLRWELAVARFVIMFSLRKVSAKVNQQDYGWNSHW
jgi:hypothetical protein